MRALKILVVAMGVMIVAGVAALIVVIAGRLSHPAVPPIAAAPIEVPPGARIEAMSTGPERLVLDLVLADGERQLVIIELASGRRLATIPLREAK